MKEDSEMGRSILLIMRQQHTVRSGFFHSLLYALQSPYFVKLFDEFGQVFSEILYHEFYHPLLLSVFHQ
jgi:hypothetical protein